MSQCEYKGPYYPTGTAEVPWPREEEWWCETHRVKVKLTSDERATYQSLLARGVDRETAFETALHGVEVDDVRRDFQQQMGTSSVQAAKNITERLMEMAAPYTERSKEMGMDALQEAVSSSSKDTFEDGTVIRWLSAGRYLYAAIKTSAGWYSTASFENGHVPKRMDFETLLEIMKRSEVTDVKVSTDWFEVQ